MTLRLPDKWIWDFWLAIDGPDYHAFYLQAPRSLGDPDLRHRNATVGHAVSTDLRTWTVLPDALHPGRSGSWDDVATWTGSIISHNNLWYLFYTGTSHSEEGRIQRIGLATSTDLVTWDKHGNDPLMQADDRWYETIGDSEWPEEAWRDPWVFEADSTFHALITARANHGPSDGRGVIGHATSNDLLNWNVQPALSQPGEFAHLEVAQMVTVDDTHLLVFSCDRARISEQRLTRLGTGRDATYSLPTSHLLGPYDIEQATEALPAGLYSGRLSPTQDDAWVWLAFRDESDTGGFVGELSDPIPYPWSNRMTQ
ncbi:MAG: glycosyl hydrolase family 32 [Acidimicrobiia bacterium]